MIKFNLGNYEETKSQTNSIRKIASKLGRVEGVGYHEEDEFLGNKYITIDLGRKKNQRLLVTRRGKVINADYPNLDSNQAIDKARKDLIVEGDIIGGVGNE